MPNKPQGGILMDFDDEKWSLFWCNLLHPVIFGQIEEEQINQYLKELAQQELLFPHGKQKTPSLSTLRRKLNLYTHGGFRRLAQKSALTKGKSALLTRKSLIKLLN